VAQLSVRRHAWLLKEEALLHEDLVRKLAAADAAGTPLQHYSFRRDYGQAPRSRELSSERSATPL
jgi:hypothetical protein